MSRDLRDRRPRPFELADETLSVRVRESQRAQTTRLIVGPRRPLEIIVPAGVGDDEIDAFIASKRRWIEKHVAGAREIASRPPRLGLDSPGLVWLAGAPLPIERRNGRRAIAELAQDRLVVRGPEGAVGAAIERWYRREARRRLAEVADREATRLRLAYRSLAVRDPRTRWGSCSRRGNLSFSWRLLLAPPDVLEYVVVHELCHLREPNHTRVFWRVLEAARPGWQEQARWLREYGHELHDFDLVAALGSA